MSPSRIVELFESQRRVWADLDSGIRNLASARTRKFDIHGVPIVARHIPHRLRSTTASIEGEAIRRRPCFLCRENMPPQQEGLAVDGDLVVFCNPFPILDQHVTIVHRVHKPQRIRSSGFSGIRAMLQLAADLPGFMVIYNGPECGASAPDHLHFQACAHTGVPILDVLETHGHGVVPNYLRALIVLSDEDSVRIESRFGELWGLLEDRVSRSEMEPMVNLVVVHTGGAWRILVFPRAVHRPEVFHRGQLTWSPGAIDMCGVVVLPVAADLDNITAPAIEQVYREVSLPPSTVSAIVSRMKEA